MILTTRQVAEKLNVDISTVSMWVRQGKLTAINYKKGVRKHLRFHSKDVKIFQEATGLKSHRVTRHKVTSPMGALLALNERLIAIENKLNELVEWYK